MKDTLKIIVAVVLGKIVGILLFGLLAWVFSSCATTRPRPADVPTLSVHQDSLRRDSLARLPAYLVPPPAGSTKRQRRQWQQAQAHNLARAGHAPVVVKIKGSTVATGAATAVSTAKNSNTAVGPGATSTAIGKAKAPVATAPRATAHDFTKAAKGGGAVAAGPKAQAVATTKKGIPWWVLLVVALGGALVTASRLIRGRWFF